MFIGTKWIKVVVIHVVKILCKLRQIFSSTKNLPKYYDI